MEVQRLTSDKVVPSMGAYVHGVRAGRIVVTSGQVARNRDGTIVGVGDIEAQTAKALENMQAVLAEAGCTLADVIKVTAFVTDLRYRDRIGDVRRRYFGEHLPASTMVEVSKLGAPELMIEIDALAIVPARSPGAADDPISA